MLAAPNCSGCSEEIADLPGRQLFVWKDETRLRRRFRRSTGTFQRCRNSGFGKDIPDLGGTLAAFTAARTSIEHGECRRSNRLSEAAASVFTTRPHQPEQLHSSDVLALADKSASISRDSFRRAGARQRTAVEEQRLLSFLRRSAHSRARQARSAAEQRRASN